MTTQQHPAQFDWATELLDAEGHVTLSAKEANEIGARLRSMGEKLKAYEDLDGPASMQLLRMGYAAARLEIESLQARIKTMAEEHADELMVAHLDGMRAAQAIPGVQWQCGPQASGFTAPQPAPAAQGDALQPVVALQEKAGMYADDFAPQADSQTARDERDDFEKVFPRPSGCIRCGTGYASTDYSNWAAHTHCERWQGWQARAARAPADSVTAPAATVIKKGADRQWMSERLGHLPDGIYSLYLAPPAQAADSVLEDAELGRIAMRFVDRAGDPHPGIDDAETICREFYAAMSAVLDPRFQRRMDAARKQGANHD